MRIRLDMGFEASQNITSNPSITSKTLVLVLDLAVAVIVPGELPVLLLRAQPLVPLFLVTVNSWLLLIPGTLLLLPINSSNKILSSCESWVVLLQLVLLFIDKNLCILEWISSPLCIGERTGGGLNPWSLCLTKLISWFSHVTNSSM